VRHLVPRHFAAHILAFDQWKTNKVHHHPQPCAGLQESGVLDGLQLINPLQICIPRSPTSPFPMVGNMIGSLAQAGECFQAMVAADDSAWCAID
jgi:hypothetical protein